LQGVNLSIAGWGRTAFRDKTTPQSLLKTEVTVMPHQQCREETLWKTKKRHTIEQHMFCAVGQSINQSLVKDACLGDSGGEL